MIMVVDQSGDLLSDFPSDGIGHWNSSFPTAKTRPKFHHENAETSALGHEQTSVAMSVIPLKADIRQRDRHVC